MWTPIQMAAAPLSVQQPADALGKTAEEAPVFGSLEPTRMGLLDLGLAWVSIGPVVIWGVNLPMENSPFSPYPPLSFSSVTCLFQIHKSFKSF